MKNFIDWNSLGWSLCGLALFSAALAMPVVAQEKPLVDEKVVFAEKNGLVAVEAEHYFQQTQADVRAFYLTNSDETPQLQPDGDPPHVGGASGGAYLEILPDTRRHHGEKLIRNENFCPQPGKMAVLHYKVHISQPGRYYVWVRAHSTGSEDNGLHVGFDDQWPESGQRLQWCQGKRTWRWESKQRTAKNHCGEPHKIFLDIAEAGEHTIHFSMREDGFEFDKWLMTTNRDFERPEGVGPEVQVKQGELPEAFPFVKAPVVPAPQAATAVVPVPDPQADRPQALVMSASMFAESQRQNYYLDKGKWLAINPNEHQRASIGRTFPFPTGKYDVTLKTVGENGGRSTYQVAIDDESIGEYRNRLATQMFQEGEQFAQTWTDVTITEGAIVRVDAQIGSEDGAEFSRARWSAVTFAAADESTRSAIAPILKQQSKQAQVAKAPTSSPTQPVSDAPLQQPREQDGDGTVQIMGERQRWHKVTLNLSGPYAHEQDNEPNPFTDYRMTVRFEHTSGASYEVPGYFAADGRASDSGAEAGTTWRAHFAPDQIGQWSYKVSFHQGALAALDDTVEAKPVAPFNGASGTIQILESDKQGRDLRAHGRLQYVGKRYLQFAGSGKYFLKVGADAPETLLAYQDFDNTVAGKAKKAPLKSWSAHEQDWAPGDPTWKGTRGKGLIGAINYLSGKGCNAFSFLTYNAGGDGDNVWPFIHRDDKLHYDCSKLDQWGIVFDHGTRRGMYLHFKMQETENDDHNAGKNLGGYKPESLDGGELGPQRKLYCRELIARFGHNLALNWNLGEENTQTTPQQQDMINYIADLDCYGHNIVVHTFPNQQDQVYRPLLGDKSKLTGVSLQNSSLETTHAQTVKWVTESERAGKPWVVAFDESGSAAHAQCPDLGYNGFDGHDRQGKMVYTQHKVRKQTLWGTLMGGGAGNEYYFGYQFDQNDIVCEDWRSRDQSWDYCRLAIEFLHGHDIPFWEMENADGLVGNSEHRPGKFCLAKADSVYLVYLPDGGTVDLDLTGAGGQFRVEWFNPRSGGPLQTSEVKHVSGGQKVALGAPPEDAQEDWLVVLRRSN